MGFFSNLVKTGGSLASQVGTAVGKAVDKTGTYAKNAAEITSLKMELGSIEQEFEHLYMIVGKKYVDFLIETDADSVIDIEREMRTILPKLERKAELENKINELEKADKQNQIMEELHEAQEEYEKQKRKLDQALQMDVITQEEYNQKLLKFKNKVDNFQEIRRVQTQYDMGIIDKTEYKNKMRHLGVEV